MQAVCAHAGQTCLRRLLLKTCPQNKLLHSCFQLLLLLLCLALVVFAFTMSGSVSSWDTLPLDEYYQRLFNQTRETKFRPPPFRVHRNLTHTRIPTTAPSPTPSSASVSPPTTPATTLPPHFHQAYAPNYHFTMDNPDACKDPPFLVLMVPVEPKNVAARDAIRKTWGKEPLVLGERVLTMFMLGQAGGDPNSLSGENLQHHDLIQSDFTDSYQNLTIKTMVIMHWLAMRCDNATFAMKIDSDMFLNIGNLVDMLKKPQIPRANYLTGMIMWNRPVIRSKNSKWYVPEEMYPEPQYPTYVLGAGYVFSNDLPARFVDISGTIKPFNIEDAYIGMCMKRLGLAPTSPRTLRSSKPITPTTIAASSRGSSPTSWAPRSSCSSTGPT
uniref:Hexosyltransferase n=1 Tax=Neogobius melanostomus TaxID=47308 RepID=A0A8C6T985_9GOBI